MNISNISLDGYQALDSHCPDNELLHLPSGNLVRRINLFSLPTPGPALEFTLTHNSREFRWSEDLGYGWRHNIQAELRREDSESEYLTLVDETGRERDFEKLDGVWQLTSDSLHEQLRLTQQAGGRWTLVREPDGKSLEFQEVSGSSPLVARLAKRSDSSNNQVEYIRDSSQRLVAIQDTYSGRALTIQWDSGRISSVTDPENNTFTLLYEEDRLQLLEMPGGCLVEFDYDENHRVISRGDVTSATTLYQYDESGRLTEIQGPLDSGVRPTASWLYSEDPVQEIANYSPASMGGGEYIELSQVFFTSARGKVWEFRFLPSTMLWREITPLGRHRRYFYDDRQSLLYSSEGFPRQNLDDGNDLEKDHPRDNHNNVFRTFLRDEQGNLLQSVDANGLLTAYTYGANSRLASVYPGQAHFGLGGNWSGHFGIQGTVLCAHGSDGQDESQLPNFVAEIVKGEEVLDSPSGFDLESSALLSPQVLDGARRVGRWTSLEQSLSFSLELNQACAFNLSLYTNSLDQYSDPGQSLDYPEFFGREIEITVEDSRELQTFRVTQNASGVWVTFPVVGEETRPVTVTLTCPQDQHRPCLSAIAFDPYEDRRQETYYGWDGFLAKTTEPTADPEEEVATEFSYHLDGTVRELRNVLRHSGTVVDSRVTRMFYEDAAKNLTRVEDPLNGDAAPTLMEYDENSNLVHLTDPDGKEMSFAYDYRRRLVRVEDGLGQSSSMTFDGRGLLTEAVDALGRSTLFHYTPARQLETITDALDQETTFTYYPDGLLSSIQDPAGHVVSYLYDDDGALLQVVYPETDVVLPSFDRAVLNPELRMAYDAWERLVAVTSPNGNAGDIDNINLLGALNVLRNGGADFENGIRNQVPMGWQEDRPAGFQANSTRSNGRFPLSVPDTLDSGQSHDWVQRRPAAGVGGRYLMKGSAQSDLETNFRLRGVVRDFAAGLSEQSAQTALPANTRTELSGRLDLPGDAQVSRTMPVLHQFRAGIEKPAEGTATASLDDLAVLALSQLTQYQGEYAAGSIAPDGARMRVLRDRFGRTRRILDPIGRSVDFVYDVRDRILSVTDSQGLSLSYEWDFLGNLLKFTDSRQQETTFEYDALNRVIKITQPDTDQFETFAYTAAGDLQSYQNGRGQERQFFYDDAHRLIRIDYLRTPDPTESVLMEYDANGNLTRLTERNGDRLRMSYDKLNRLKDTARASVTGPRWTLANGFDSRGNRTSLKTNLPVYGSAEYGEAEYGTGITTVFSAHYNALNQMDSLTDSADNTTEFAFDLDGRLAEVNHPVEDLQTRYRYDLVGKLLESRVALDNDELWKLNYTYNLAGERLSQHSVWADGGNAFEYRLDDSGRLIRESINRFVCDGVEDWAAGENAGTAFALDGKLRLLARDDDFSPTYLDLQRWEIAISEPVATSVSILQNNGLQWRTSAGDTLRNGRVLPAGTPIDSSNVASDYPHIPDGGQVADTVGWFEGRMLLRHRTPLTGAFDISVSLADFDVYGASIGLGVTRDRFETGDGANRFPTDFGGVVDPNGCDLVVEKDGNPLARFNDEELADVTVTKLRLKRFLDGSDWKLSAYYHDGDDWVTDPAWVGVVDDQELFAYLHLSGKVGYLRWSDFLDTVGDPFPTEGSYESRVYDAGRSVDWTRISWNEVCPAGAGVSSQVAVSEDANGPWSYGSALTTAAGSAIASTTGRYARFKLSMTSDGSDTPVVNDVQISHDGTSGSRVTRWTYDDAGNITEQARVTDAGVETDVRSYNNLNQLTTSSGGWTYQFDLDGNMVGKDNGNTEGCEKWEFTWNENSRLAQVKKGVYDATPALVNEFTVDYQYDEMGRMLRRDDGTDVTLLQWDGWDLLRETTGESDTDYLVPNLAINGFWRAGKFYSIHSDGLGTVRSVTDSDGALAARIEVDAWGRVLGGSFDLVPCGLPMNFVGALGVRTDKATGLIWMRHRWFDPICGRFVSRDPVGLSGGANLYAYVGNNPTDMFDHSGLSPEIPKGWSKSTDLAGVNAYSNCDPSLAPYRVKELDATLNSTEIRGIQGQTTSVKPAGTFTEDLDDFDGHANSSAQRYGGAVKQVREGAEQCADQVAGLAIFFIPYERVVGAVAKPFKWAYGAYQNRKKTAMLLRALKSLENSHLCNLKDARAFGGQAVLLTRAEADLLARRWLGKGIGTIRDRATQSEIGWFVERGGVRRQYRFPQPKFPPNKAFNPHLGAGSPQANYEVIRRGLGRTSNVHVDIVP